MKLHLQWWGISLSLLTGIAHTLFIDVSSKRRDVGSGDNGPHINDIIYDEPSSNLYSTKQNVTSTKWPHGRLTKRRVESNPKLITQAEREIRKREAYAPRSLEKIYESGRNARLWFDGSPPKKPDTDLPIVDLEDEDDYQVVLLNPTNDFKLMLTRHAGKAEQDNFEEFYEKVRGSDPSIGTYLTYEVSNTAKGNKKESTIIEVRYSPSDKIAVIESIYKIDDRCIFIKCEIPISELTFKVVSDFTNGSPSEIKGIMQHNVVNADTKEAMEYAFDWSEKKNRVPKPRNREVVVSARRYGGDDGEKKTFNLLLGTRNIKFVERMLKDHHEAFAQKRVEAIHFYRAPGDYHLFLEIGNSVELGSGETIGPDAWEIN